MGAERSLAVRGVMNMLRILMGGALVIDTLACIAAILIFGYYLIF